MSDKNLIHTKWMKRAIYLASLGKNTTSPNPKVGAVILDKNGNLISEGFHFKAGMPHAEAMAFNNLKKDAKEGSMYVNLEPCCHHGKTPPCVDYIISSGSSNSLKKFVNLAFQYFDLNPEEFIKIDNSFIRPADISYSAMNPKKILRNLGWKAEKDLDYIVKSMIENKLY